MDRICVFCGANTGNDPHYAAAARSVGETLARRDIGLVYGGGRVGLMGEVAEATLSGGGEVIGVIPEGLLDVEEPPGDLTDLEVVDSFQTRKERMGALADGFLALPGGFGTLDELVEAVTWTQHGIHDKPCAFLDVDGFFTDLVAFFDGLVEAGFVSEAHRDIVVVEDSTEAVLAAFERWDPTP
jgi:uncharacterized protein (TIGR00730 family)